MNAGDLTTAGLTGALVLVTGYYAWQNHRMVKEMRRARELSIAPHLAVVLWPVGPMAAFPRVVNVGQGPALDVDFTLVFEADPSSGVASETRRWTSSLMAVGHHEEFMAPDDAMTIKKLGERYRRISVTGSMRDAFGNTVAIDDAVEDVADWQRVSEEAEVSWEQAWPDRLIGEIKELRRSIEKLRSREG